MAYSVIQWHGNYYVKGESCDPPPPNNIGPYRFEADAQKVALQLNSERNERPRQETVQCR